MKLNPAQKDILATISYSIHKLLYEAKDDADKQALRITIQNLSRHLMDTGELPDFVKFELEK